MRVPWTECDECASRFSSGGYFIQLRDLDDDGKQCSNPILNLDGYFTKDDLLHLASHL